MIHYFLNRFSALQKYIIVTTLSLLLFSILYLIWDLVALFLIALLFSYLITPLVDRLDHLFSHRLIAVVVTYLLFFTILFLFLSNTSIWSKAIFGFPARERAFLLLRSFFA